MADGTARPQPDAPAREDATAADVAQRLDSEFHAAIGRFTAGLSPTSLAMAWLDWSMHLAGSPARRIELANLAWLNAARGAAFAIGGDCDEAVGCSEDHRFSSQEWREKPFSIYAHWFGLAESFWNEATTGLRGVEPRHEQVVNFTARQILDMLSPSNGFWTNPVVLERTRKEGGANLLRGAGHWLDDFDRLMNGRPHDVTGFRVGETVAITPGEVVYRNRLIELIRYRPTTATVKTEPLLIVPAWIMKYYILDLSPENSLVRYLTGQGFEVYMISWKNPGSEDSDLGMEDYLSLGIGAAMDELSARGHRKFHGAGYCLGGTLLSIAAAAMARDGDDRLASLSLLAAQTDFSEAGEITLFISESQVAFLEDMMTAQGYLKAEQMSGAFQLLRSNDLIWSRVVRHYLLGDRTQENDLMSWNADTTRMPARMHSDYLRDLFLENRLATGRYRVDGHPIAIEDIIVPVFAAGTEKDHVAPWHSVWKIIGLLDRPVTFLLASGGHNTGIVAGPENEIAHYRTDDLSTGKIVAEEWKAATPELPGSWWPAWADWLAARSSGERSPEKHVVPILDTAPGRYVFG